MVKKLVLAIAVLALATPAFAAVQNVKVGGALKTTSILRDNMGAVGSPDNQAEILAQTELNVTADLTDNVSTNIGLLNERLWGNVDKTANEQSSSTVQLETAYVTMKEFLYAPLTVSIGRQPLKYGNELVIGSSSDSNAVTQIDAVSDLTKKGNFDAVKAVLSYDPLTVDFFASRIDNNATVLVSGSNSITHDNINLYGVNLNYKLGDKMSTVVEAYTFVKANEQANITSNRNTKNTTTYVPGLRVSTNPIEGLNVQLEGAYQFGRVWNNTATTDDSMSRLGAYALQGKVNYALPVMKDMKPVMGLGYRYLSGDKRTGNLTSDDSTRTTAWQAMYENQDAGRIFDTLTANTNSQLTTVSMEISPLKDLTAQLSLNSLWLAQKNAYLRDVTTPSSTRAGVNSSKYRGSEVDLDLTYAYTEDVKFGVSAGYFVTGKTFVADEGQDNKNKSQILSSVSVLF
ncbi:MAG: alginate export family protein [Candidatus Omnitrophica bacterium]|nr:alginate export family protein [Candidatus Omnitrophota bacterium]